MSDPVPFNEREDNDSIDDLIGTLTNNDEAMIDANQTADNALVENILKSRIDDVDMLGSFILVGEIIDSEGNSSLMVTTSENLPDWVARGMIMVADDFIAGIDLQ